jgi:hypothetical protein
MGKSSQAINYNVLHSSKNQQQLLIWNSASLQLLTLSGAALLTRLWYNPIPDCSAQFAMTFGLNQTSKPSEYISTLQWSLKSVDF